VVKGDLAVRGNNMQKEFEIKSKVESISEIRKKLKKIGARKIGIKRNVDIYYTPESGEKYYGNRSRLKFRIRFDGESDKGRLEVHKILNLHEAIEYELPVGDVKMVKIMLKELRFKQCSIVDKVRESYKYGSLNIELDKVKELGEFMEVEIMNSDRNKAVKRINEFYKKIGVSKKDFIIGGGYGEMMIKHNQKSK
jgi:adenylate cyclase, class 2